MIEITIKTKSRGGKKCRKYGRDKNKCALWRAKHGGGTEKKFNLSKEKRGCGPLGYYMRSKKGA